MLKAHELRGRGLSVNGNGIDWFVTDAQSTNPDGKWCAGLNVLGQRALEQGDH
jgi:hypothetical protein